MKKIKYMLILIILFVSCAELVYNNKSNINYDVYSTAFVYYIRSDINGFPLQEQRAIKHFRDKLQNVSGFQHIYTELNSPQMEDSADIKIMVIIKDYAPDTYTEDDEDQTEKYKVRLKVQCKGITKTGNTLFKFTKKAEEDEEYDWASEKDDIDHDALLEALDDISIFFLKSFEI